MSIELEKWVSETVKKIETTLKDLPFDEKDVFQIEESEATAMVYVLGVNRIQIILDEGLAVLSIFQGLLEVCRRSLSVEDKVSIPDELITLYVPVPKKVKNKYFDSLYAVALDISFGDCVEPENCRLSGADRLDYCLVCDAKQLVEEVALESKSKKENLVWTPTSKIIQ